VHLEEPRSTVSSIEPNRKPHLTFKEDDVGDAAEACQALGNNLLAVKYANSLADNADWL
jgi:hypothetical protein